MADENVRDRAIFLRMMRTFNHHGSRLRTTIADVKAVKLQAVFEPRGNLVVGEWSTQIPFQPKRFFIVSEVPANEVRGNHAHRTQHQFLVLLQGVCTLFVYDGSAGKEMVLNHSDSGVYVPPLIWTQYSCSANTILLVLASDLYEPEDYVSNPDEFASLKAENLVPISPHD